MRRYGDKPVAGLHGPRAHSPIAVMLAQLWRGVD